MSNTRAVCLAICSIGIGCASAPKNAAQQDTLKAEAKSAVAEMTAADSDLKPLLDRAAGYVVFPHVKQGGFIVGASAGRGVLYEHGAPVGYAELHQGSVGAQIGGQAFSEVVVLEDQDALAKVKESKFAFGGQASAVAIKTGAASSARFDSGVAVFVHQKSGAMLNLSLTGQRIKYSG